MKYLLGILALSAMSSSLAFDEGGYVYGDVIDGPNAVYFQITIRDSDGLIKWQSDYINYPGSYQSVTLSIGGNDYRVTCSWYTSSYTLVASSTSIAYRQNIYI